MEHLDQKYGAGSETKIQLNGYARDREALEVAREREEIARARDRYAEAVREKRTDDAKDTIRNTGRRANGIG